MGPNSYNVVFFLLNLSLLLGISVVAVAVRLPLDRRWSIGGDLSKPQRTFVLAIIFLQFASYPFPVNGVIWQSMFVATDTLFTWSALMTPFLLRRFMQAIINLTDGTPGGPLTKWLFSLTLMVITGVSSALFRGLDHHWALVRLADAASVWPVIVNLRLYNMLTTPTGMYRGRGLVIAQAVMYYEYYFGVVMLLAAIGEAFQSKDLPKTNDGFGWNEALSAGTVTLVQELLWRMRKNDIFYQHFVRLLIHSIFVNQLDEMNQTGPLSPGDCP